MQKTISIIRGNKNESYDDFHSRIKAAVVKILTLNPEKVHYTITLEKPPIASVIPFSKKKIALVSVRGDDVDVNGLLINEHGFAGTFKATEALPVAYDKDWPDGEITPGVCLLTLFRQKKGIDYETFLDRWHNGHTPFTLKVHPIYHYNRNVLDETLGTVKDHYDAIVEEHCRTKKELLNPFRFFARSGFALKNMILTYFDTKSFIDYKSMETYMVQEYHLVS